MMKKSRGRTKATALTSSKVYLIFSFCVLFAFFIFFNPSFLSIANRDEDCTDKPDQKAKVQVVGEERIAGNGRAKQRARIALVNVKSGGEKKWVEEIMEKEEEEEEETEVETVQFTRVSPNLTWADFFPAWIDEDEKYGPQRCPPMPVVPTFAGGAGEGWNVDVVVVELPCGEGGGGRRDVAVLQVNLVAAAVAVKRGRRNRRGEVRVAFRRAAECGGPMPEIFRHDDLVRREGLWWVYEVDARRLLQKLALPVGSCRLALRLTDEGSKHVRRKQRRRKSTRKQSPEEKPSIRLPATTAGAGAGAGEAYATVLHSSDSYVCGAIALAQSLRRTGTTRPLVLLHDSSISGENLAGLSAAGWSLHQISLIRNPHASQNNSYNANNYTKLRLWQLTAYRKIVFVDADVIVLRNLDALFSLPQLSATADHDAIFNSGVMVLEPSAAVFAEILSRLPEIVSYNNGDQGFLNEVFVWWHRLPRRVGLKKMFAPHAPAARRRTADRLFAADPPELYSIHYFGMKPWMCYRDYDCNWDIQNLQIYASDAAHRRWWLEHDLMPVGLQKFCRLTKERKSILDFIRQKAGKDGGFSDRHWKIFISDERRFNLI